MRATIEHLEKIVSNYTRRLKATSEEDYARPRPADGKIPVLGRTDANDGPSAKPPVAASPRPGKWSKKEILGHLVDSAQNNIRRFIVAQYEEIPRIGYDQDKWVAIADYQHYPTGDLILLWRLLNLHICRILKGISPGTAARKCEMGNGQQYTIEWLAADYCNHLLHHLHQILELDPIAYP